MAQVFVIPPEFGMGSIGNLFQKAGAAGTQIVEDKRRRTREDFTFDQAKLAARDAAEARVVAKYGVGSDKHKLFLEAHGESTEGLLTNPETLNAQLVTKIGAIPEDQRTEIQKATFNRLMGMPIDGIMAELDRAKMKTEMDRMEVDIAKQGFKDANDMRKHIEDKYDMPYAQYLATKEAMGYKLSELDIQLRGEQIKGQQSGRAVDAANIRESNARVGLLGAQAAQVNAETAAGGKGGYDEVYVRQLATAMTNNGIRIGGQPVTPGMVAQGLSGNLGPHWQSAVSQLDIKQKTAATRKELADLAALRTQADKDRNNGELSKAQQRAADERYKALNTQIGDKKREYNQFTASRGAQATNRPTVDLGDVEMFETVEGMMRDAGGDVAKVRAEIEANRQMLGDDADVMLDMLGPVPEAGRKPKGNPNGGPGRKPKTPEQRRAESFDREINRLEASVKAAEAEIALTQNLLAKPAANGKERSKASIANLNNVISKARQRVTSAQTKIDRLKNRKK